jgi:hypothetical protein
MKTDLIQAYNPQFTAYCNIRGNIDALDVDQLRKVIVQCKTIGNMKDQIDIYIPSNERQTHGVVPMAAFINGEVRAFIGKYHKGNVFEGIMSGINFAKNHLYIHEVHNELQMPVKSEQKLHRHNNQHSVPKLKHLNRKEFDNEIYNQ